MKWLELKEFANSLSEEQLQQNVILCRDEEYISIDGTDKSDEDLYFECGDDNVYTLEELMELGVDIEDYSIIPEGTVSLFTK